MAHINMSRNLPNKYIFFILLCNLLVGVCVQCRFKKEFKRIDGLSESDRRTSNVFFRQQKCSVHPEMTR